MHQFKRSSFCGLGACVEVAQDERQVIIRNSQRPTEVTQFSRSEWEAFVRGAKAGEFDEKV